ncbi:protein DETOXIFICATION 27-like [Fagus crenata]
MGVREEAQAQEPLLISASEQQLEEEANAGSVIKQTWLESKKMWAIAGPSIFSRLALFSMTVITQAFAGHLSNLDLAAISIASTVIIAITFDQCGGGAIRCGGDVADSDAPQLPISVHVTEVLAEPSEDWGYSLDLRGCSCTPRVSQAFVGLWEFFKLSVASGVMLALENFYYRVLIIVSGYLHNTEIAVDALSICITIFGWESMIPLGFLAATGVRVANELGAGNAKGAKFATTVSVLTSLIVGLLFWSIIIVFHEKLAMIFTTSTPVIEMVNELAVLLAFTILLNCIQPVLSGVAVGSGWQAIVAFVNIGSYYIVGVPLGVLLGWLLGFGIRGIWTGMISGTVVQTLILAIITLRCEWEQEAQKAQILITKEAASNH